MNKKEYAELVERELSLIKDIVQRKNNDYTGTDGSAFANFESTPKLASPFAGVLIRMGDKMKRLETYATTGSLAVVGEGAEDAARDVIGYSLILLGMLADAKNKPVEVKGPIKLKVGKSYRARNGDEYGPVEGREPFAADDLEPFRAESPHGFSHHYLEDGRRWPGANAPETDLVEEVK